MNAGILIEKNLIAMNFLSNALSARRGGGLKCNRVQNMILVKMSLDGGGLLRDIARRLEMSVPALCQIFRVLEKDGMVVRTVGNDRRDVWYDLSAAGKKMVEKIRAALQNDLSEIFSGLSESDERDLLDGLEKINLVFNKMINKEKK